MISRKDFLERHCSIKAGYARFTMNVSFQDLYNMCGIGGLNDRLDEEVEGGNLFCGVYYNAIGLHKKDIVTVEVFIEDLSEWLNEENW